MQIKLFNIPVSDTGVLMDEMNTFLRGHKVLDMEQKLIQSDHGGSWCFCIRYIEGPHPSPVPPHGVHKKVDYKEVLSAEIFAIFSHLRECRKQLSKEHGVAAYIIFTDEELAGIAGLEELNEESLETVKGISTKKVEKYGKALLELYHLPEIVAPELFNASK
ncbi:helicase [Parabacteroides sp. 52]|uniref:HRDC domain-containing protein n=1 Tax=unclassified Parabacteroides TaxID=2649774 RepID=UPI0013D004A5|nr:MULTISPECIES: HRDC domain-containing protein [unclassified Parabacteroides]MDH6535215.1 superfamily II DNA helicase RecQ [Parabacteroides sp. PM5-20]NDV55645.1 helicase [Parabacteroides sp. 52]